MVLIGSIAASWKKGESDDTPAASGRSCLGVRRSTPREQVPYRGKTRANPRSTSDSLRGNLSQTARCCANRHSEGPTRFLQGRRSVTGWYAQPPGSGALATCLSENPCWAGACGTDHANALSGRLGFLCVKPV